MWAFIGAGLRALAITRLLQIGSAVSESVSRVLTQIILAITIFTLIVYTGIAASVFWSMWSLATKLGAAPIADVFLTLVSFVADLGLSGMVKTIIFVVCGNGPAAPVWAFCIHWAVQILIFAIILRCVIITWEFFFGRVSGG